VIILAQFAFGRVLKLMLPAFFSIQMLVYQVLFVDTNLPNNVIDVFYAVKDAIELNALPRDEVQEFILPGEDGKNLFSSGGFLLVLIPAILALTLLVLMCIICTKCS
jgi:hypothetical protein